MPYINKSKSNDWTTPPELYKKLDEEFNFDFDPCPINPTFDGLTIGWGERNFVNPPYNKIKAWLKKGIEEWKKGKIVVFLIPARTDTSYWHEFVIQATKIDFIKGRLKFGGAKNSAPFPSVIVIFQ